MPAFSEMDWKRNGGGSQQAKPSVMEMVSTYQPTALAELSLVKCQRSRMFFPAPVGGRFTSTLVKPPELPVQAGVSKSIASLTVLPRLSPEEVGYGWAVLNL
jgi:hypothetical protein